MDANDRDGKAKGASSKEMAQAIVRKHRKALRYFKELDAMSDEERAAWLDDARARYDSSAEATDERRDR